MREKLVSYLLGELDAAEAAEFERRLTDDADLAAELERLRPLMPPGSETGPTGTGPTDGEATEAPPGLAERTADSIHDLTIHGLTGNGSTPAPEAPAAGEHDPASSRCSFSLIDAAVAVGVVMAVGMMLLPALRESRESARRIACQQNLHEIGVALQSYAADRGGYYPMIAPDANAGSFTVILAGTGHADRERLAELVVCPASQDADRVSNGELLVRVPTFEQLAAARGPTLAAMRRVMALSFAYRLPYRSGEDLRPIRNESNPRAALLSDAPTIVEGQWRSLNHGGCGQNVLFQDGGVRYVLNCCDPMMQDHLFVNAEGRPEAPTSWNDAVLVRSEFTPQATRAPAPPTIGRESPAKVVVPLLRARVRLVPREPCDE